MTEPRWWSSFPEQRLDPPDIEGGQDDEPTDEQFEEWAQREAWLEAMAEMRDER